jgi:hypothetical protein
MKGPLEEIIDTQRALAEMEYPVPVFCEACFAFTREVIKLGYGYYDINILKQLLAILEGRLNAQHPQSLRKIKKMDGR